MPNQNIASTRSKAFAAYQVSFEAPRPSIEKVAITALEEPEEGLTPLESLERSLHSTVHAAASEAAMEWALQQLERGMDLESAVNPNSETRSQGGTCRSLLFR